MAYLDDIIIYLDSKEKYKEYIKQVLKRLYDKNIPIILKKCEFYIKKTNFVGFIIKLGQISIDLKKIIAIIKQQNPESVIGLRLFLGFYNYYRRFIIKQLEEIEPFIRITKKDEPQNQDSKKTELFKEIKKKFTKEPILKIYRLTLLIRVKIDTLDFVLGVCLLQKHREVQYLVIYYSRKIILLELNYDIYNKELLVIVIVLKEQRAFLQGTIELFIIKIDYKDLISFLITKELNR